MNGTPRKVVLNRPVFTQRAFDSSTLTVLTSLLHRFPEAGDYDLLIRRGERVIHRSYVHVAAESAPPQINVDLASLGDAEAGYTLIAGGVIGFYVSEGTGEYAVTITQLAGKEQGMLLDSRRVVPRGDLFAVTLVRPGAYRVVNAEGHGEGEIYVSLPKGKKYRVDQAELVEVGKEGMFRPAEIQILAGQTVVFRCSRPARIRIELVKPQEGTERAIERQRYKVEKREPKQSGEAGAEDGRGMSSRYR